MSAPVVEWSDPLGQAWLALVRGWEPMLVTLARAARVPFEPVGRELVLWCDHPSSRGAEGQVFEAGRAVHVWQCDLCEGFWFDPVPEPVTVTRFDQQQRVGVGVLRADGGLEALRQIVEHQVRMLRQTAAARDGYAEVELATVTVELRAVIVAPERKG